MHQCILWLLCLSRQQAWLPCSEESGLSDRSKFLQSLALWSYISIWINPNIGWQWYMMSFDPIWSHFCAASGTAQALNFCWRKVIVTKSSRFPPTCRTTETCFPAIHSNAQGIWTLTTVTTGGTIHANLLASTDFPVLFHVFSVSLYFLCLFLCIWNKDRKMPSTKWLPSFDHASLHLSWHNETYMLHLRVVFTKMHLAPLVPCDALHSPWCWLEVQQHKRLARHRRYLPDKLHALHEFRKMLVTITSYVVIK